MTYKDWFLNHAKKHQDILKKLENKSSLEIIEYFKFENMQKNEIDFCPLYRENKKCHNIEDLNCYLCACPHFRFSDIGIKKTDNKVLYSFCSIESKYGLTFEGDDYIHQDCSNCNIPHKASFIKRNFKRDWLDIMKVCVIEK